MGRLYSIPTEVAKTIYAKRRSRAVTCAWCSQEFVTTRARAAYCSDACAERARTHRVRMQRQERRLARIVGVNRPAVERLSKQTEDRP